MKESVLRFEETLVYLRSNCRKALKI